LVTTKGGVFMSGESYTIKELSQLTGYSPNTIRGYIKTGKLKSQLVNNKYQIPQEEAERVFKIGKSIKTDTDLITELRNRINQLESDKAFLQKQVMDLQETIRLLTIKQLPGNQKGVFTRIKEFFVGKEENN